MKSKRIKLADSVPRGRIIAYVRASTSKQIASPDVQKGLITEYATRLGLTIDEFYVDPATTSKFDLFDRPAGKRLLVDLRPGRRAHCGQARPAQPELPRVRDDAEHAREATDHPARGRHAGRRLRSRPTRSRCS